MAKPIIVLISWIRTNALNMASFAHNVAVKMTGNSHFTEPAVNLETLDAAATRVELAYGNRMNGPAARNELDNAESALDDLLHDQADYVSNIAEGNTGIILSAGFEPTKGTKTASTVPAPPCAPKIKLESGGTLRLSVDKVSGADSYLYVVFLNGTHGIDVSQNAVKIPEGGNMIIIPNGGVREELNGLVPGAKVNVQVLAQNRAGKSPFGPMVSSYIISLALRL